MARISIRTRRGTPSGPVGRIFTSLFFLVFLGAGLVFTWMTALGAWQNLRTFGWPETTCTITASSVAEDPVADSYEFNVTYRYRVEGHRYTGYVYRPGYAGSDSPGDAHRLADRYPAGATVPCRVDPGDPDRSTLRPGNPWITLVVLIPLIFVAVGAGGLWFIWKPKDASTAAAVTDKDADPKKGVGYMVAFCGVFAAAGLALFIPFFAIPAAKTLQARSWPAVPAVVEHSQVRTHSGDDSNTYSIEVVYRYRVGGREYTSDRYDFMTGSSSGYEGKAEIVERYSPGTETLAYVDPDDPWEAVLYRGFRAEWLFALLPLIFVVVGVGGMTLALVGGRRLKQRQARGVAEWMPDDRTELEAGAGPVVLEPAAGPIGKLLGIIAIAAFWNGIVGVFVWGWWNEWKSGSPDGCLTLFLIPFVLVGLLLLISVPYQFLALFNPRPVLTLDGRRIEVGGEVNVGWRFKGRARRIRHLKIHLEAREEASYTRGTDRVTDKHTFLHLDLVDSAVEVAGGNVRLAIPADTMHSFEAGNNKVVWVLKLHGTIDRWPDVMDEFPLAVHPAEVGA